ncbi:hypothetical protein L9F63_021977, partial [Diploptera punctata]
FKICHILPTGFSSEESLQSIGYKYEEVHARKPYANLHYLFKQPKEIQVECMLSDFWK